MNGKTPCDVKLKEPLMIYCSDICRQKDWQQRHQFDCPGKKNMVIVSEEEVRHIEKTNLFLRKAQRGTQSDKEKEEILSKAKLSEFKFEKIIGKGSYGEVKLAIH